MIFKTPLLIFASCLLLFNKTYAQDYEIYAHTFYTKKTYWQGLPSIGFGIGAEKYFSKKFSLSLGLNYSFQHHIYPGGVDTNPKFSPVGTPCNCYSVDYSYKDISIPLQLNYFILHKRKISLVLNTTIEFYFPFEFKYIETTYHIHPFVPGPFTEIYNNPSGGITPSYSNIAVGGKIKYNFLTHFGIFAEASYVHRLMDMFDKTHFYESRWHSVQMGLGTYYSFNK